MKFKSADGAMRAYLDLLDNCGSVRSLDPYEDVRDIFVDKCPECGKKAWRWEQQKDEYVCQTPRCGTIRPREKQGVFRGTFIDGAARVRGDRVSRKSVARVTTSPGEVLAALDQAFVVLMPKQRSMLALKVRAPSWAAVVHAAEFYYPGEKWYERKVRKLVAEARRKVEHHMVFGLQPPLMDREHLAA